MVSIEDIRESADSWMTVQKPGVRDASGIYARRRFISYTTSWLSYMGQLICEDDAFPFKEHVMELAETKQRLFFKHHRRQIQSAQNDDAELKSRRIERYNVFSS